MIDETLNGRMRAHMRNSALVKALQEDVRCESGENEHDATVTLIACGMLEYWLSNFVDVCSARWETASTSTTYSDSVSSDLERDAAVVALGSMFDLNVASQDPHWNSAILRILSCYRANPFVFVNSQTVKLTHVGNPLMSISNDFDDRVYLYRTYIPRLPEVMLSLMREVSVRRWREPEISDSPYDAMKRRAFNFRPHNASEGTFEHFVRSSLPYFLPLSIVENFLAIVDALSSFKLKVPRAIFTANLHVSSDSFVIWMAHIKLRGSKIVLSQHGGLNGQGFIPTRGEEYEKQAADTYLNWGWADQHNCRPIPAQITMWKRKRKCSNRRQDILLITDCTYRLSRRAWSDNSDNEIYRQMLMSLYGSLRQEHQRRILVRLHHDHSKYDESHAVMWTSKFPDCRLDDGHKHIEVLRRKARLTICTTLGTSEIEQFARSVPTVLRLDPFVHALRPSCVELFQRLERLEVVHWSDQSLTRFLDRHIDDIDKWWSGVEVQESIGEYLQLFGRQSKYPLREFRQALIDSSR